MQYRVLSLILQDGHRLQPGETAEFFGEEAEQLLKLEAIAPLDQPFAAKAPTSGVMKQSPMGIHDWGK